MKKNCTNCKYAEFELHPSGKRNLIKGKCTKIINIPLSYYTYRNERPIERSISKYTGKVNSEKTILCECWSKL